MAAQRDAEIAQLLSSVGQLDLELASDLSGAIKARLSLTKLLSRNAIQSVTAPSTMSGEHDGPTQRLAALRALPESGTRRSQVLMVFVHHHPLGFTDKELEEEMGLSYNSTGPRRRELVDGGWVRNSLEIREGQEVWIYTGKELA